MRAARDVFFNSVVCVYVGLTYEDAKSAKHKALAAFPRGLLFEDQTRDFDSSFVC
jgi:hypothetical protein